ncbi:hypothetical protein OS493_011348 [Desmophyllum pertusum]|uniref:Secreted protein n=1 Tax=Desmophyllum pertusum TaxID=174260 RepID=A0A9X0CUA9_9CNID|nr:hypothetical protein OS493_011348 [Desmophyllum pertusum]
MAVKYILFAVLCATFVFSCHGGWITWVKLNTSPRQDCATSSPSRVVLDSSICSSPRPSTSAGNTKGHPPVTTKSNTEKGAKTIKKKVRQDCATSTPSRVVLDSSICSFPRPSTSAGNTKGHPPVATKSNTEKGAKTKKKKVTPFNIRKSSRLAARRKGL